MIKNLRQLIFHKCMIKNCIFIICKKARFGVVISGNYVYMTMVFSRNKDIHKPCGVDR